MPPTLPRRLCVNRIQGTGTGRGMIAGISLQAIVHISQAMIAGSQKSIGMINLLRGLNFAKAADVPFAHDHFNGMARAKGRCCEDWAAEPCKLCRAGRDHQ
jgi:hypothetical protein